MAAKAAHPIVTITVSPALDKSTEVGHIVPESKLRCNIPQFEAGGGGINVAKVIKRLGGQPMAIFTSGGPTGRRLESLVKEAGIVSEVIETKEWTRENFNIIETYTGLQYRFSMPGHRLMPTEVETILDILQDMHSFPSYLVASGSLPEGVPTDLYGQMADIARSKGARFVLDTVGEPLRQALEHGVYLLKPNITELSDLVGAEKLETDEVDEAARALIIRGNCEVVVVSMGAMGAMLVTADQIEHIPAPPVRKVSAVGAGDSMVAGIVWTLSQGKSIREAVRMGVACGTAATMTPGSELCRPGDVTRVLDWLNRYGQRYGIS